MFLDNYLAARKHELAAGTHTLHKTTANYLKAFFKADLRIDQITKQKARQFKTDLAGGLLSYVSKRPQELSQGTVDGHMRNARTMFNFAIADDMLPLNPFKHLCQTILVDKEWHYITADDYNKLVNASPASWQLLFALCRLAGLRRSEALHLAWNNIDWEQNTILVISKENWKTKTRRSRKVPMCPELQSILAAADPGNPVVAEVIIEGLSRNNLWRDFHKIRETAGINEYKKPFQVMRKSCAQDWADYNVPVNSLHIWMGHTKLETTMNYYLKASKLEYQRAAETNFFKKECANSVQKPIKDSS
ncbi:MAG: hypothetical protein DRP56_08960 [Planctomycetota bacterium]|nr:MAG: hypothetical protein DRP56_08960 [Planctomycetota bacterium]